MLGAVFLAVLLMACSTAVLAGDEAYGALEKIFYLETFDLPDDPFTSGRWVKSMIDKYLDQPVLIKKANNAPELFAADKGLHFSQEMKFYGVSSAFPKPVDVKEQDLVVQYEVKFEESLTCGGAYIKLPQAGSELDLAQLSGDTKYSIMFGPDRCGATNKVHFIIQYQNPRTKEWEEKHFNETVGIKTDQRTHLYTLHIKHADSSFDILIDMKVVRSGNLLTHMVPAINPPAEIDDPTDSKPDDWVDEEDISDPDAVKPEDWDETLPLRIPDHSAKKPEGWLDDEPEEIPDPDVVKPDDWDDEEDGEWEAPMAPNPACAAAGCGEWKPPLVKNPAYKGKWSAPKIPNPAYKGPWAPRKIENPAFFKDENPAANIPPMGGLSVEIWTTNAALHFDNFIVVHSISDSLAFAQHTFAPKSEAELKAVAEQRKREKRAELEAKALSGDWKAQLDSVAVQVLSVIEENPRTAAATFAVMMLTMVGLVVSVLMRSPPSEGEEASSVESGAKAAEEENEGEKEGETEGKEQDGEKEVEKEGEKTDVSNSTRKRTSAAAEVKK